jgi:hypothetical protein
MTEMSRSSVSLTSHGLGALPSNLYTNDFTFIVGPHHYPCPLVVADFLSPRLCRLHQTDCSIREYELNLDDSAGYFAGFLSLARGATVVVSRESRPFYLQVCGLLENAELLSSLISDSPDGRTLETALSRLKIHSSLDFDLSTSNDIAFVASNFSDIPLSDLTSMTLDTDVLSAILSHPSLKVQDEDSIVSLIRSIPSENAVSLIEFVYFEYLSESGMDAVIQLLSSSFEMLSFPIWERVCARLRLDVSLLRLNPRAIRETNEAIVRFLTELCHTNIHDAGLVSVTAPHTNPDVYGKELNGGSPNAVFDLDSRIGWYDCNKTPSWLQVDFLKRKVRVASYTITFGNECRGYIQRWTLEGSADGKSWVVIDDHSDETKKRNDFEVASFECNRPSARCFRYLRLAVSKACWGMRYYFGLSSLEFFGTLHPRLMASPRRTLGHG